MRYAMMALFVAVLLLSAPAMAQDTGGGMADIVMGILDVQAPVDVEAAPIAGPVDAPIVTVEEPAPATVEVTSMPEVDINNLPKDIEKPAGLAALIGLLVYLFIELLLKGFIPKFASATAAFKVATSVSLGLIFGTLFGFFGGVPYVWWVATVAGGVGAATVSAGRAIGKGIRGKPQQLIRKITGVGVGILLVAALTLTQTGCLHNGQIIGGQAGIWATGGVNMAKCLNECGMPALTDNITLGFGEVSVDTTGMGDDALACLINCSLSVGVPTIITSVAGAFNGVKDMPAPKRILYVTAKE